MGIFNSSANILYVANHVFLPPAATCLPAGGGMWVNYSSALQPPAVEDQPACLPAPATCDQVALSPSLAWSPSTALLGAVLPPLFRNAIQPYVALGRQLYMWQPLALASLPAAARHGL